MKWQLVNQCGGQSIVLTDERWISLGVWTEKFHGGKAKVAACTLIVLTGWVFGVLSFLTLTWDLYKGLQRLTKFIGLA